MSDSRQGEGAKRGIPGLERRLCVPSVPDRHRFRQIERQGAIESRRRHRRLADQPILLDGCDATETKARLRELRVLVGLYCGGWEHPAATIFTCAITGEIEASEALPALDLLPSLPRRKILASFGELT